MAGLSELAKYGFELLKVYAIVAKNDKNLDDARVLVKVFYVRNVRSQQSIPSERTRSIKCVRVR